MTDLEIGLCIAMAGYLFIGTLYARTVRRLIDFQEGAVKRLEDRIDRFIGEQP